MSAKNSYRGLLQQDMGALINTVELPDLHKHFLRSRWLDQLLWMESRARGDRRRYYTLRLTAIIGSVVVPALVGLNLNGEAASTVRWMALSASLLVAVSMIVEEFLNYGERWRRCRETVERLKTEGWQFFQLSGPYQKYQGHAGAYDEFVTQVEKIIQREVRQYITEVAKDKEAEPQQ